MWIPYSATEIGSLGNRRTADNAVQSQKPNFRTHKGAQKEEDPKKNTLRKYTCPEKSTTSTGCPAEMSAFVSPAFVSQLYARFEE